MISMLDEECKDGSALDLKQVIDHMEQRLSQDQYQQAALKKIDSLRAQSADA